MTGSLTWNECIGVQIACHCIYIAILGKYFTKMRLQMPYMVDGWLLYTIRAERILLRHMSAQPKSLNELIFLARSSP